MKRILIALLLASCALAQMPESSTGPNPAGGGVGGASGLTIVGNIPQVTAAGILGLSRLNCALGVCTLYGDTAVTGVTQFNLKAGAAQATVPTPLLNVWLNTAGTTPGLHMLANGNVGIGTTPAVKLDVIDDSADAGFRVRHSNLSQGISIGYNTILANGSAANLDINITSKGTGDILLNNGSVGIGQAPTVAQLEVNGDIRWMNKAEGTCDVNNRGRVVLVQGGAGVSDSFRICSKDSGDAYAFRALIN